jgi:drug/metabolite transporter (DMT)-like permease
MELPLLLALASALTWGAGDFFGGLATRQAKAVSTTFISQFVGLIGLIIACVLGAGGSLVLSDLGWGTAAGLCAVSGLGLFYESMGRGPFGPVASITSVTSGAIPIIAGLALGERPSTFLLGGVGVAVVAIWLIAGEKRKADDPDGSPVASFLALGAGVMFGFYFVFLSRAGSTSGLWPLVAGRSAATLALGTTILVLRKTKSTSDWIPKRQALRLSACAGLFDASANALYFYASRNGLLSVVAVLASLYPVSTIGLARVVLRERLNHRRLVGMVVGLFAVSIIAKGSVTPKSDRDRTFHAQPVVSPVPSSAPVPVPTSVPPEAPAPTPGSTVDTIETGFDPPVPVISETTPPPTAPTVPAVTPSTIPAVTIPESLAFSTDELVFEAPFPVDLP